MPDTHAIFSCRSMSVLVQSFSTQWGTSPGSRVVLTRAQVRADVAAPRARRADATLAILATSRPSVAAVGLYGTNGMCTGAHGAERCGGGEGARRRTEDEYRKMRRDTQTPSTSGWARRLFSTACGRPATRAGSPSGSTVRRNRGRARAARHRSGTHGRIAVAQAGRTADG